MKRKPPTVSKLKKKAWSLFSKYLRMKYADADGYCACYTCGTVKHYKELQAGHLLTGRGNAILFEWNCVRPQCYVCNIIRNGNHEEYVPKFMAECGEEEFYRLKRLKKTVVKFSISELEDKIAELKAKIKGLEDETKKT